MKIVGLSILFLVLTVVVYFMMNILYVKYYKPLLLPILTSTVVIILILVLFNVPYETYMLGGKWVDALLGPAIVSLAIPLYKQGDLLKKNLLPIVAGVFAGVLTGMVSGVLFMKLFGFSKELVFTLLPKSITTPIAMQIASGLGGIGSLAAVFVMIAGFSGGVFGPTFLRWTRIHTPTGRGLGLGVASHAIGTAKAIELGEQEASVSSVAMTLYAILGSLIGPVIAWIFY